MECAGKVSFASASVGRRYVYLVENFVKPRLGEQPDPEILDAEAPNFHKLAGILDAGVSLE